MTPQEHTKLVEVLAASNIPAEVLPVPEAGQDVRFVDVRTNQDVGNQQVLNTLENEGMLQDPAYGGLGFSFLSSEVRIVAEPDPKPPLRAAARIITFEHASIRR